MQTRSINKIAQIQIVEDDMKLKWLISTAAITLMIVTALLGFAGHDAVVAAQDEGSKIEGLLLDKFTAEGSADFIVRFTDQADLSAAYSMDWEARGEFVYNTLRETAANSQVNAKAILDVAGLRYETFIAGNDLYVWSGTQAEANGLAALPEVSSIRATRTYYIDPYISPSAQVSFNWAGDYLSKNALTTVSAVPEATTDWGITDSKADQFWTAFGVQGDGIKVANIDTGVQWNHPALDQSFACPGQPNNAACWSDPSNICGGSACDNNGHGTHTMGTMVADDDQSLTYIAGMAPNATWIACKGCETNSCSDMALNACADWILAPGGSAANRPDVVNNSWGGGGNDPWYQAKVQAWVAAGVFPAFSAGNSTGCTSMGSPGDYQESFATTGHNVTRVHYYAQGPSLFGHEPYTKPNITSPAVNVCSSVPTNGWNCGYSGTSMASPHSAGAVALLWSCNPDLVGEIDLTFQALQNTADVPNPANPSCGVPPDGEGTYEDGYGYLNVLAAGTAYCGTVETGTLEGHVFDENNDPVEGATVNAQPVTEGNAIEATTDPNGFYTMALVVGTYNVTASKLNYTSQTVPGVAITVDTTTVQDFVIEFLGSWTAGPDTTPTFDWYRFDGEFYPATGLIYFMGGRSSTITDGTIYSYNPVSGAIVDTGTVMPVPISNYTVNLVNNGTNDVLCMFGGRDSTGATTLAVQCYNPVTNTASVVAQLPAAWTGYTPGAQVVVDNLVYIFGGFQANVGMTARTDVYNPVTHNFTQLGNLNLARAYIMATEVDGIIYAFGGDTWDGVGLVAQTIAEKLDPAVGTWNDAGLADLPSAGDEGVAFGFDTSAPYEFAGQIIIATLSQWSENSSEVVLYDVATNSYDVAFPNTLEARRNHAGVFVPLETTDPADGLPGMWVFGGYLAGDAPPYAGTEFFPVGAPGEPDIELPLDPLVLTLYPNQTGDLTFLLDNVGTDGLAWSLAEDPAVAWLSVLPVGGDLLPGDPPVTVTLTFDSTGLAKGAYTTTLVISSDDPDEPEIILDVTLNVVFYQSFLSIVAK
jgi:hypothetical protein